MRLIRLNIFFEYHGFNQEKGRKDVEWRILLILKRVLPAFIDTVGKHIQNYADLEKHFYLFLSLAVIKV